LVIPLTPFATTIHSFKKVNKRSYDSLSAEDQSFLTKCSTNLNSKSSSDDKSTKNIFKKLNSKPFMSGEGMDKNGFLASPPPSDDDGRDYSDNDYYALGSPEDFAAAAAAVNEDEDGTDSDSNASLTTSSWHCNFCGNTNRKVEFKYECEGCHMVKTDTQGEFDDSDDENNFLRASDVLSSAPFLVVNKNSEFAVGKSYGYNNNDNNNNGNDVLNVPPRMFTDKSAEGDWIKPPPCPAPTDPTGIAARNIKNKGVDANQYVCQKTANNARGVKFPMNEKCAKFFDLLSKEQSKTKIMKNDSFRSRNNKIVAGKLRSLEYDISGLGAIGEFSKMKGAGPGAIQKLLEFISTGKSRRLDAMSKDKYRQAIKELSAVWGIGESTGKTLVSQGIYTREMLKSRLEEGKVKLDFRQMIGLKYCEELLVPIPRTSVWEIAMAVKEAAEQVSRGGRGTVCLFVRTLRTLTLLTLTLNLTKPNQTKPNEP